MSEQFIYQSVFAPYFKDFLAMKENQVSDIGRIKWMLLEFDKFFVNSNIRDVFITKSMIDTWKCTRIHDKKKTLYDKVSMFRQFCLYLCHIGKECYIPKLPKKEYSDFTPYVFTRGQMQDIFEACDKQRMHSHNIYCNLFALPALYRILYATGIRIGEAISIRNRDVGLRRNCIIIRKTKNKMERLIPLSDSLSKVLQQYLEYRNKMPLPDVDAPDKFLLISPSGRPLSSCTVLGGFKKVLEKCNIPCSSNRSGGACIHSLRHTFAVHSLAKMVQEGMDIYCALPLLSVFLGHKTLKGTETYVRLTQDMFPDILLKQNTITRFVYPQTNIITNLNVDTYEND